MTPSTASSRLATPETRLRIARPTPAAASKAKTPKPDGFGEALKTAKKPTKAKEKSPLDAHESTGRTAKTADDKQAAALEEQKSDVTQSAGDTDADTDAPPTGEMKKPLADALTSNAPTQDELDAVKETDTACLDMPTALPVDGGLDTTVEKHADDAKPDASVKETHDVIASTAIAGSTPTQPAATDTPVALEPEPGSDVNLNLSPVPAAPVVSHAAGGKGDSAASTEPTPEATATAQTVTEVVETNAVADAKSADVADKAESSKSPARDFTTALEDVLEKSQPAPDAPQQAIHKAAVAVIPNVAPEQRFAADNIDKIVTSVHTELLPKGGSMQLRLDPPEMGALSVTVRMNEGVLSASFQTSNDEATKLLSHSMGQLKTALETMGVTVDKISVRQSAPAESTPQGQQGDGQHQHAHDHPARQEQQRRKMLQRMWRKLAIGSDPLDMVA